MTQASNTLSLCTETQLARLREHVAFADQNSPYYQRTFREAGITPDDLRSYDDLARFPFIKKDQEIADQKERPPFGALLACDPADLARIYCTAGQLYICFTRQDLDDIAQSFVRQMRLLELGRGDIADVASAYHYVIAGTLFDEGVRACGATVVPGGPGQSELRLQVMKDLGVTVLQAFTPYAEALGHEARAKGFDPDRDFKLRLLLIGGELRSAESKDGLGRLWGNAKVRELYGASEAAGLSAVECLTAGDGMHLNEDVIFEIVDPATGERVADPGQGGEVVMTSLVQRGQPFVRYRTGDITEGIDLSPCACGVATPRLRRIVGRASSILRVKGLFVDPTQVQKIVAAREGAGRCRLILDRPGTFDRLMVEVEHPSPPAGLDAQLVRDIKAVVNVTAEVSVVAPGTIPADAPLAEDRRRM